jgi:hypothetical protein
MDVFEDLILAEKGGHRVFGSKTSDPVEKLID